MWMNSRLLYRLGHTGAVTIAATPEIGRRGQYARPAWFVDERTQRRQADCIHQDAAVPIEHLADYIDDIDRIVREAGTTYSITPTPAQAVGAAPQ
jgi:FAD/FMN-containing dehydrogenase